MADELKLYELTDAAEVVTQGGFYTNPDTGEIYFEPSQMDALTMRIEDKLAGCVSIVEKYDNYIKSIDGEIKRLQTLKKSYKSNSERMKGYMLHNIKKLKGTKLELPKNRISIGTCPPHVEVYDLDMVPDEYKRVTVEPDKRAILAALQSGEDVPGAALVSNERLVLR